MWRSKIKDLIVKYHEVDTNGIILIKFSMILPFTDNNAAKTLEVLAV